MLHLLQQLSCFAAVFSIALCLSGDASGQSSSDGVLKADQLQQVDEAVDRGLQWLAAQQQPDGSFPTMPTGQPGVTSLCVMAFMGHGHLPGQGRYGAQLTMAIDYIMSTQKRNGILAFVAPNGSKITRNINHHTGYTVQYNHAIAGLVLSESYAIGSSERTNQLGAAIRQALDATLEMQQWPKERAADKGGWRYLDDYAVEDSDLSVTGWQLMFLRSAKNAGFDIADEPVERAIGYIRRCFDQDLGTFIYEIPRPGRSGRGSRGMAGAGILALAHAGLHHSREAKSAGDWLLRHRFDVYNGGALHGDDHYHYGLLTCCQAMYQLGGHHWEEFFPSTAETIVANQKPNGSWSRESNDRLARFGNAYTSAACLIGLGAPNQLLPIFQR